MMKIKKKRKPRRGIYNKGIPISEHFHGSKYASIVDTRSSESTKYRKIEEKSESKDKER